MNSSLSAAHMAELDRLELIRRDNFRLAKLYSHLLNLDHCAVKPALIRDITQESSVTNTYVYYAILASLFGLDEDESQEDAAFLHKYLSPSVKELYPFDYQNDPYIKTVTMPHTVQDSWQLTTMDYAPCQAFIFRDPIIREDFTEIPMLGFFMDGFSYPAVLQGGREWMTVTPNEIETMKAPIAQARGRVVTFGLGLGYFAFMAARKDSVNAVTVVERDQRVIRLFTRHILPQLPCKDKITLVCADAFDFLRTMKDRNFDYAFADIWHDTGDGLPLYVSMKQKTAHLTLPFDFWIESSLLCRLRWLVFDHIYTALKEGNRPSALPPVSSFAQIKQLLSFDSLKRLTAENGLPPLPFI